MCSPGATWNEQSCSTSCSPVYENETDANWIECSSEREERGRGATGVSLRPPSTRAGLAAPATNEPTGVSLRPPAIRSGLADVAPNEPDRKSTRLNSSHL